MSDQDTTFGDQLVSLNINPKKLNHENEYQIHTLNELSIGDHAVLVFNDKTYCHCIIEKIENNNISIIYYDDGKNECDVILNTQQEKCRKVGTKKAEIINFDQKKFEIFKVVYNEDDEICLNSVQTLLKANELVGKTKYNIFENNDEHFAIYCKTGKAGKIFLLDPQEVNSNEVFGGSIAKKIKGNLAQTGTNIILVNTAKHLASRFPRSIAAAALPSVAEAAGSVIGIGIEGIAMGYDIHKKYKDNKDGKLSTIKFKKYIARRVTRGTFGVAGGIGGGIIGQLVVPVPVVGALVGGFVGGLLGAAVGYGQGVLIGELVEKIDTKIKEKKELVVEKTAYNVLGNLVFKFDKDVLKEDDSAEAIPVINNDDYDIYVINNVDDNLVQNSVDDAVDIKLPLDLSLYISLNSQEIQ
jgi:hypothetical protein